MADWLSYRLSDFLLFSRETYYRLYELYNAAVWPAHLAALAAGLVALACLTRPTPLRSRLVAILLGACWLWIAIAFHLHRYATINWAADGFAAAFVAEAALLLWRGFRGRFELRPPADIAGRLGFGIFLFALVAQPLLGPLFGRSWRQAELFGLAPDPTTVATLGALLLASGGARWVLLPVPLLWCVVSGATTWGMETPDALLLPLAGAATLLAAAAHRRLRA